MADNGATQTVAGIFLIVVGSVVVLGLPSGLVSSLPPVAGAVAMLLMTAGAQLAGVHGEDGRPV